VPGRPKKNVLVACHYHCHSFNLPLRRARDLPNAASGVFSFIFKLSLRFSDFYRRLQAPFSHRCIEIPVDETVLHFPVEIIHGIVDAELVDLSRAILDAISDADRPRKVAALLRKRHRRFSIPPFLE